MQTPTIVFDLDGTLVDTAPDLVNTLNTLLAEEGCDSVPFDEARVMIGQGARALLQRGLQARWKAVSPDHLDALFARFIKHYEANIAVDSQILPGLQQALVQLQDSSCRLAVCTNKLENLSRKLLDELNLDHYFSAICGGDTFPFTKPDPRALLATIAKADGEPSRSIMVGDSITDVKAAKSADIPVILVDFGYSELPLASLGADIIISGWDELPAAVEKIVSGFAQAAKSA